MVTCRDNHNVNTNSCVFVYDDIRTDEKLVTWSAKKHKENWDVDNISILTHRWLRLL